MTQAELFEEAARVARMVEGTGIKYWECIKFKGKALWCEISLNEFFNNPNHYEFALALVEGKPVFKGDVLYNKHSKEKLIVASLTINGREYPKPNKEGRYRVKLTSHYGHSIDIWYDNSDDCGAVFQALTDALEGK